MNTKALFEYDTYFLLPDNHSSLIMVGSHKILVGGNKSSWKYAVLILGTVKDIGSIVLSVSLKALANSTSRTLHVCLERKANPWCKPEGLYGESGKRCGASVDTSKVVTVLSPCKLSYKNCRWCSFLPRVLLAVITH